MKQNWNRLMKDSISEVLSSMFFSPVEFDENCSLNYAVPFFKSKSTVISEISVTGDVNVKLYSAFLYKSLEELTKDFTGREKVGGNDCMETFKEMLNMIIGSVLADCYKGSDYRLNIPEILNYSSFINEFQSVKENTDLIKVNLLNGEAVFLTSWI
ncbi:MAG: chemotaxis protein CheX [Thermodesulfobacteriota bacterium]